MVCLHLSKSPGHLTNNCRWSKTPLAGNNAVENALYLTAAAKLANRLPATPSSGYYYNEAIKAYDWFMNSGLINSDNLINDNLNSDCENDLTTPVFTYNQGIILSGLTELAWAAPATEAASMNALANTLALAGIAHFTDSNGVLHEACESTNSCSIDLQQFKGIFGRNVQFMVNRANGMPSDARAKYISFLQVNANSIWSNDQASNQLGLIWSGPKGNIVTIQTQSSALDVIVGAACVS
jgi:predicted alpha-1,6-mannanase (GH76 family)